MAGEGEPEAPRKLPMPTGPVLQTIAWEVGRRCSRENMRFARCKQEDLHYDHCIEEGKRVQKCVHRVLLDTVTRCPAEFDAVNYCITQSSHELLRQENCRRPIAKLRSCLHPEESRGTEDDAKAKSTVVAVARGDEKGGAPAALPPSSDERGGTAAALPAAATSTEKPAES